MKNLLTTLSLALMTLFLANCGNQNTNPNNSGYYNSPNPYCLQTGGAYGGCSGYGGYNPNSFSNYPMANGMYNYNAGCQAGWSPVYGNSTGLGCFNQGMYPGNYYNWNGMGYAGAGFSAYLSCNPYMYNTCPTGYCRPINGQTGICSN